MHDGDLAEQRLQAIAAASQAGAGVTRLPWTAEHLAALEVIGRWMADAGLQVRRDAAGTLIGRSPGPEGRPALLIGSHQDSVRNGGRYDGIMGVALGCLAARRFRDRWDALPFALEVLAFADEEGVRFPTALIGPRALAGTLDPAVFAMTDQGGETMAEAMRRAGADASAATALRRDPGAVVGYLEAHIEQGPVLETEDLPLGIVTGICGITRAQVTVEGETGHAGTVPMPGRRDALVAAARLVVAIRDLALSGDGLRATVGQLQLAPNVVNAIPASVDMTLETRSMDDRARRDFAARIQAIAASVADEAGVAIALRQTYDQPAVACDPGLRARLEDSVARCGIRPLALPSGATHDASAMADLCPVAMLFLRCRGGVSHRPDEFASAADMGQAVEVLAGWIEALAETPPT